MAYATINPATGEQLEEFPEHTPAEVEAALSTAHDAYGRWRRLTDLFPLLKEKGDGLCRRFPQVEIQHGLLMAGRVLFAPQLQQQTRLCVRTALVRCTLA